jgi:hypothetical protein
MKISSHLFYFILILFVASCQSRQDAFTPPQFEVTGRWELIQVVHTNMIAGQPNKAVAPPYKEFFEFKADSTFVRERFNGYKATGTYSIQPSESGTYAIIAKFDNKELSYHEIAGERQYSYTEGQVYLQQEAPDKLIESYMASDGDSFVYQKVDDTN